MHKKANSQSRNMSGRFGKCSEGRPDEYWLKPHGAHTIVSVMCGPHDGNPLWLSCLYYDSYSTLRMSGLSKLGHDRVHDV